VKENFDMFWDRDGRPITFEQWQKLFWDPDLSRIVARTDIADGVLVSTVWLGTDSGLSAIPHPYETMVFGGVHDGRRVTWANEDSARAGHDSIVAYVRDAETKAGTKDQ
jgi:hypothetical protein